MVKRASSSLIEGEPRLGKRDAVSLEDASHSSTTIVSDTEPENRSANLSYQKQMSYRPLTCLVLALCAAAASGTQATELPKFNVEQNCATSEIMNEGKSYPSSLCIKLEKQGYTFAHQIWNTTKDIDRKKCSDLAAKEPVYRYHVLRDCLKNNASVRRDANAEFSDFR